MRAVSPNAFYVTIYCSHVGFFALDADEQRARLAAFAPPNSRSLNEGAALPGQPLTIAFHSLRDAAAHIYIDKLQGYKYLFIAEELNDALCDALSGIYRKSQNDADFFDTARLEEPLWNALRDASRAVWNALDDAHRLPFGNWRDFAG